MSPACCRTPPGGAYVLPDMIRENIISQGDFTMGKKRPALRLKQIRPRLRTVLSASLVTALVLLKRRDERAGASDNKCGGRDGLL